MSSRRHHGLAKRHSTFLFSVALRFAPRLDCHNEEAAQIVEFAVALPLLILFVVGIFDFSNAFTLKQKLTNITRDAARTAASEPTSDLSNSMPLSVSDGFYIIDNYLKANNISDCGVAVSSGKPTGAPLTWKFSVSSSSGSPCGITIIINRGYYFPVPNLIQPAGLDCVPRAVGGPTMVVGTCISIQYAYPWRFGQVASLIGGNTLLPAMISAQAVSTNEF